MTGVSYAPVGLDQIIGISGTDCYMISYPGWYNGTITEVSYVFVRITIQYT